MERALVQPSGDGDCGHHLGPLRTRATTPGGQVPCPDLDLSLKNLAQTAGGENFFALFHAPRLQYDAMLVTIFRIVNHARLAALEHVGELLRGERNDLRIP